MDPEVDAAVAAAASKAGVARDQLTKLVLDGKIKPGRAQAWLHGLANLPALRTLELNACNIASLEGFPSLPALRRLRLSDNRIPGGLEALASGAPGVESLDMSNNKIVSVEALRPLASLASLSALDLLGCPLASGDEAAYRAAVFALLPQLKLLDHRSSDPDAEEESDDEEDDESEGEEGSDEGEEGEEGEEGDEEEEDDEEEEGGELGTAFLLHGNADAVEADDGDFDGVAGEASESEDIDDAEEEEEEEAGGAAKRPRTE